MVQASLFVLEFDEQTYKANTQPMLSHIATGVDIILRVNDEYQRLDLIEK